MTSWGCTGQLFVGGWAMLAVSTTWHGLDHQKSSKFKDCAHFFSQAVSCPSRVSLAA